MTRNRESSGCKISKRHFTIVYENLHVLRQELPCGRNREVKSQAYAGRNAASRERVFVRIQWRGLPPISMNMNIHTEKGNSFPLQPNFSLLPPVAAKMGSQTEGKGLYPCAQSRSLVTLWRWSGMARGIAWQQTSRTIAKKRSEMTLKIYNYKNNGAESFYGKRFPAFLKLLILKLYIYIWGIGYGQRCSIKDQTFI